MTQYRIEYRYLRRIRYTSDCVFDENYFSTTLKNCRIKPSVWMNNNTIVSNKLSDIVTHPKYQYS